MTKRRDWMRSAMPRRLRTGTAVLVTAAMAVVPIALGASVLPAQAYTTSWQSGVNTGQCQKAPLTAFAKWRGSAVERTSGYVGGKTFTQLSALYGLTTCLHHAGVPVTLSVPMLPASQGTLVNGAKGKYNAYWTKFGKNAVKDGYANATLRIGWEMNGNWFKWSATKDPTHWKQYWIQIVKTLRKVPNSHFTFEWSVGLGKHNNFDPAQGLPGQRLRQLHRHHGVRHEVGHVRGVRRVDLEDADHTAVRPQLAAHVRQEQAQADRLSPSGVSRAARASPGPVAVTTRTSSATCTPGSRRAT